MDNPPVGERDVYPDIRIVERGRGTATKAPAKPIQTAEPLIVPLENEPITETFIEIIDIGSGRRVVSVIEVLSPANKRQGSGREQYLKKQRELLDGGVSLVEIDLLREGKSVVGLRIRKSHDTPYNVVVRRGWKPTVMQLYPVALSQRLPTIKVPLRHTDADVPLDLQTLLDRAYDNGAYQDDLDYQGEPDPPLDATDAAWADALLREKGLRTRPATPASRTRKKKQGP